MFAHTCAANFNCILFTDIAGKACIVRSDTKKSLGVWETVSLGPHAFCHLECGCLVLLHFGDFYSCTVDYSSSFFLEGG